MVQYLFTERTAKYWPISTNEKGVSFHAKEKEYFLPWHEVKNLVSFPETPDNAPVEWSQSMFSSGVLLHTKEQQHFVIYKKIQGYEKLLQEIECNIESKPHNQ